MVNQSYEVSLFLTGIPTGYSHKMTEEKKSDSEKNSSVKSLTDWITTSEEIKIDTKRALIGGVMAALTTLAGAWTVGKATGNETFNLLQISLQTARSFAGTITLALGNILALMLTLLSLSAVTNIDLKWTHYLRIKQIAWVTACTLIASILIYQLLNIPLSEAEGKSVPWFAYLYYATLATSSILGGALISIVLMLYNAAKDIILVLGPKEGGEHLIHSEEQEEKMKEAKKEEKQ